MFVVLESIGRSFPGFIDLVLDLIDVNFKLNDRFYDKSQTNFFINANNVSLSVATYNDMNFTFIAKLPLWHNHAPLLDNKPV